MNDVREAIRRAVEVKPIPNPDPDRLRRTVHRRRLRRRITAGAVAIVAASGGFALMARTLQPQSTVGPPSSGKSHVVGDRTVVGRGSVSGESWALIAYESNMGLCVDLQLAGGSGGGCGFDVPENSDLGLSVGSQAGITESIIHGVVSERVSGLVVRVDGGENLNLEIIDGPNAFDVNFFVGFLPPSTEGIVEARDDQGVVLDKERLRSLVGLHDLEAFTEEVLDVHKLAVYYPDGWNRASEALIPTLDGTTEILSLGTYALRPGAGHCVQIPERAIESLGPMDAFVTLQESFSAAGFPTRPDGFSAADGEVAQEAECLDNAQDLSVRVFRFTDGGRFFIAYIAIGDAASTQTRKEVWQILEGLIVCEPTSPPGDCL